MASAGITALDRLRDRFGRRTVAGYDDPWGMALITDQDWLRDAADMDCGVERSIDDYERFDRYYRGDQKYPLTDRLTAFLEASGLSYVENFCETLVDGLIDRCRILGFSAGENEPLATWLTDVVWARNRMHDGSGDVHHDAVCKGDGFFMVDYAAELGRPTFAEQRPEQVKIVYDDEGNRQYGVKVWSSRERGPLNPDGDAIHRMNLLWPDRIEKWFAIDGGAKPTWAPWVDEDDLDFAYAETPEGEEEPEEPEILLDETTGEPLLVPQWPVWWTMDGTPDGEPIGINLFHVKYHAKGANYGQSKLRGVIPQQDALMKVLIDLAEIIDQQGAPQRYALGVNTEGGSSSSLTVAHGEYLTGPAEATIGQLDPADVEPILKAIDHQVRRIASRAKAPLYQLMTGGTDPSGESLKTAEAPQVRDARDFMGPAGNEWADAMGCAVRVTLAFGELPEGVAIPEGAELVITTNWDNPASRDELGEITRAEGLNRLGVSKATLIAELGYDPEEEARKRAQEAKEASEEFMRNFDRGGNPDDDAPDEEDDGVDDAGDA